MESFEEEHPHPIDIVEDESFDKKWRPTLIKMIFIVLPFTVLFTMLFSCWAISQAHGGPAIGALIFGIITGAIVVFLPVAIWKMKYMSISE